MKMKVPIWRRAPFIRLLAALTAGILLQWNLDLKLMVLVTAFGCSVLTTAIYFFLTVTAQYRFRLWAGFSIQAMVALAGALLLWGKDIRNNAKWFGHVYRDSSLVVMTISEPPVEKANSWKALALVEAVGSAGSVHPALGQVIIYFKKDSVRPPIYGSRIAFKKPLQEIRSSGNPGSFDYRRYCHFKGITHQVYLTPSDLLALPGGKKDAVQELVFLSRDALVNGLQQYIPGKKEQGLAEALLIGYKEDLDKELVQAYADTGVVHVIAISGLHLGLVYGILIMLTRPLKGRLPWIRALIIVVSLWAFSLLAGAQPSVLRSAVMFTCMAAAEAIGRKSSIYNTLALSAFVLLCYNPYWLWDAGFQLSYSAVISIVLFFRPVYNWVEFQHSWIDAVWKLNAVTLSAQLLTLPVSLYHFHQFPLLFLFTNLVAVPLSGILLFGEIILCLMLFWEDGARALGWLLGWGIRLMNHYVEWFNNVSYSVWEGLQVSFAQTVLLTMFILAVGYWLKEKHKPAFIAAMLCLLAFVTIRSVSFIDVKQQGKMIVYNIPKFRSIDLLEGRRCIYLGDTAVLNDRALFSFHLESSRVLHRVKEDSAVSRTGIFEWQGLRILIANPSLRPRASPEKTGIDLLVLGGKPRTSISDYTSSFRIGRVVLDGSVPPWKAQKWKSECDSLRIPCHDVAVKGAFVLEAD
jgi:competence protein ComEC